MGVSLRPYQKEAVESVLREMGAGVRRQLISLPTGAGKTVCGAEIAWRLGGRTLFLVHRDELVPQTVEKFTSVWPEASVGIVKAEQDEVGAQVVVASIQTLARPERVQRLLSAGGFGLVIYDESHHGSAPGNVKVLEALGVLPEPPDGSLLLGMTATPYRADGIGLDRVFERVTYRAPLISLIQQGYLADVRAYRLETALDLSKVRVTAGDFNEKDLALAVNTPKRNRAVVAGYQKYAAGRKAIAFTVDVQHARDLAAAFKANGIPAEAVWGAMPERERRAAIERFRSGRTMVLANCSLLTEGFDEPSMSAIIMARPTNVLFAQACGRGLRPYPGKSECVVIDLGTHRHDICHVGSLVGMDRADLRQGVSLARQAAAASRTIAEDELREGVKVVASQADILGRSLFVWKTAGADRLILQASPTQRLLILPGDRGRFKVILRESGREDALLNDGLSLGYAQGVAEDWVREQNLESFAGKDARWRSRPASPKQRAILRGFGVEPPDDLTKQQASEMIEREYAKARLADPNAVWRSEPATEKQIAWLTKHGLHPKPGLTRGEAADRMTRFFDRAKEKARRGRYMEGNGRTASKSAVKGKV